MVSMVELKNDETETSEIREFGDGNNGVAILRSETVIYNFILVNYTICEYIVKI